MARRQHLTLTLAVTLFFFFTISYFYSSDTAPAREAARLIRDGVQAPLGDAIAGLKKQGFGTKSDDSDLGQVLDEGSIAPKLENATLKAELGRATWKFLHTMAARYPEKPTPKDRETFLTFFDAFGRLYPCGDCASHFRKLKKQIPPQTSSRNAAAGWLCHVHNKVNKRLEKPLFDCANIGDFYDCGCGDDDKKGKDKDHTKAKGDKKKREQAALHEAAWLDGAWDMLV
ncbi:hypothetical protein CDD82_3371 [Ophiocordyceps australis]|uniref:Sulfhydryl oxidase n=1 Tax=Ophiocordyceps australis TaxID=1399860 RepID=A0A2C5ZD11_9HYPO|nr:hypothetical protein CDD82_3371 [Ophiocordyceps australis]